MLFLTATAHAQAPSGPAGAPSGAPSGGVVWSGPASGADIVYLKDGQQIRGTLLELRVGESAIIRLPQGQTATIRWEGIARIERNGQPVPLDAKAAQPQAPAPPLQPTVAPETLPYDSNQPIPAGYHVEKKVRLGLLIPGAVLTGIGLFGIVGFEASSHTSREDKTAFDVVWGLLFLGPGLPLLLVGLLSPKKYLQRDSSQASRHASDTASLWSVPSPEKQPFYVGFSPTKQGGGLLTIGRQF